MKPEVKISETRFFRLKEGEDGYRKLIRLTMSLAFSMTDSSLEKNDRLKQAITVMEDWKVPFKVWQRMDGSLCAYDNERKCITYG